MAVGKRPKRNVTLTLDEGLLTEARVLAARRGISVSALLSEFLSEVVSTSHSYQQARQAALARLRAPFAGPGQRDWTRDQLYDERLGFR